MKKLIKLAAGAVSTVLMMASVSAEGMNIAVTLTFNADPSCSVNGKEHDKGDFRKYDDESISWSTGCVLELPKSVSHCAMTGLALSNPDSIASWSSDYQKNRITVRLNSEADINPTFGKFSVHYFCH